MNNPLFLFFESVPPGEKIINQYQYVIGVDYHPLKWISFALFNDYVKDITGKWVPQPEHKFQFINDFLDYHFSKYSGDPEQFFFYLRFLSEKEYHGKMFELCSSVIEKWIKDNSNTSRMRMRHKREDPKSFESLFKDTTIAIKVKKIFEIKGYTVNGEWHGLSNDKSELLCAYYVLKDLIKPGLKVAPTVKIFYSEFGLAENHITDRMMTTEPFNDIRKEFEIVFSDLLEPKTRK